MFVDHGSVLHDAKGLKISKGNIRRTEEEVKERLPLHCMSCLAPMDEGVQVYLFEYLTPLPKSKPRVLKVDLSQDEEKVQEELEAEVEKIEAEEAEKAKIPLEPLCSLISCVSCMSTLISPVRESLPGIQNKDLMSQLASIAEG